ncbi:MAG: DUF5320 domain-containing protein [Christensenellales bacterium]
MPRRDGTGPIGKGQKTGRGLGPCANPDVKESSTGVGRGLGPCANPDVKESSTGVGRGLGLGRRCGLRRGRGFGRCARVNEENKE